MKEYRQLFPSRRVPQHQTFGRLRRLLRVTGTHRASMHDTARNRTVRTPETEDEILRQYTTYCLGVRHSLVSNVLHYQQLHPYHILRVEVLAPKDFPQRVQFAQ